ncbi:hypothetical protein ABPG72_013406 [Tetrahymena utriculariae]
MNSLLNRPQSQKAQINQFCNFQERINVLLSSASSLDTSRVSNNFDKDYWINYYTQQKVKEKEEKYKIQFLSDKKQPTSSLNGKRQLIFSRPYKCKVINKKQVNMKLESCESELGERVLDCFQQQENCQIVQQEAEQRQNQQVFENQNNLASKEKLVISPCLSQNNLQSMISQKYDQDLIKQNEQQESLVQLQLQKIQQYNTLLQNSTQFQTPQSTGQISPIQSVSTLAYRQSQDKPQQKQLECIGVSSQHQISSNTNNIFQSMIQINNVQPFKSANDIIQRKNSILKDDSNYNSIQPSKNQLELQCIHVKKLKGIGEKQEKEIAKNLFSNNHLILATSPNNQHHGGQTQNQFIQNATPKVLQSQNSSQVLLNNVNIMQNNKFLEKSIINFQKQKAISTIKYNSFLQDLNTGSLKSSIHLSGEQNKQSLGVQSQQDLQYCKLKTESGMLNGRGCITPTTMKQDPNEIIFTSQNNYQDSFLENKDQFQKLFLLEGYSQINQVQKLQQFHQNNSADIIQTQQPAQQYEQLQIQPQQLFQQQQQYIFPKSQAGNQAQFFQELNKQRIISGNTSSMTQNSSNVSSVFVAGKQQQNVTQKKRLASANQYNRKLMSNYKKQELLATKISPEFINSQLDEQNNIKNSIHIKTQISNNIIINSKNNKNKTIIVNNNINSNQNNYDINQSQQLSQQKKIPGFNVLEGIQQLSAKHQLQGSQSTNNVTSSSQINNYSTNKQFKLTNFTSPKTQKSFQVLYKICNKNILNTGLKEQKSKFIKLI